MKQNLKVGAPRDCAGTGVEPSTALRRPPSFGVAEPLSAGFIARQLFEESMAASLEHLRALEAAIGAVRNLSDEIVDGGALYVAGLPELAQNLNEDLLWASIMLEVLSLRQSERASSLGVSQLWASLFGGDN